MQSVNSIISSFKKLVDISTPKTPSVSEVMEEPSKPSWLQETVKKNGSFWNDEEESTVTMSSIYRSKMLREKNKRLKCIYEDEGMVYGPDVDESGLVERFKVAVGIRTKRIDHVFRDLRASRTVDLCFLVDVTGSMQNYIDGVKKSIKKIVDKLTNKAKHVSFAAKDQTAEKIRLSFVAYRDFNDTKQFVILNFTESIAEFQTFCKTLKADGGGDTPEDVFGGIEKMLELKWDSENTTKVCFHIADSPCHGKQFHKTEIDDSYPDGDPNGRTHTNLFAKIREKNIQYHFGKIRELTTKMIEEFSKVYGEPIVEFDIAKIDKIHDSVITAVKSSVVATITKTISTSGRSRSLRYFTIDEIEPNWSEMPKIEGVYVSYELPKSISDIVNDVPLQRKQPQKAIVQIATSPFAQGAERIAFYGKDVTNSLVSEDIVLKEYKHMGAGMLSARRYETTNQIQAIAAFLAKRFVAEIKETSHKKITITFLKVRTLSINDSKTQRIMSCERRFLKDDKFLRFTNNTDYGMVESTATKYGVNIEFVQALMAFSHWTYEISKKCLMVVDLQGVVTGMRSGEKVILLTDPAIHCDDTTRFGPMNLGIKGMKNFFTRHVCNKYCDSLGLTPVHFTEI